MPRPVYIICYQTGMEDKETGLVSLFHIIEKLQITPFQIPEGMKGPLIIEKPPLHIIAAWMKNPIDDPGQEYEYEMLLIGPDGNAIPLAKGTFFFTEKHPLHKFKLNLQGPLPLKNPGIMTAECKIRKLNDKGWLAQNYPMLVEIGPPAQIFSTNPKDDLSAKPKE